MIRHLLLASLLSLTACTTGQSNATPPFLFTPSGGTLKLAVGTINFATFGFGINVLETYRGANGLTAVPINSAVLTGPATFAAPVGSMDPGSGASIVPLGSARNQFIIGAAGNATNLASADGFGIGPPGTSAAGMNFFPAQPQFADAVPIVTQFFPQALPVYGGPPLFPPAQMVPSALSSLVLVPSGWAEGFYLVALSSPPPSGTYNLAVKYLVNGTNTTVNASAQLNGGTLLPPLPQLQIATTGDGGVTVTLPVLPPGVVQVIANVIDTNVPPAQVQPPALPCTTGIPAATIAFKAAGTQRIAGNLGPGGNNTFCRGDRLALYAFGFDYDDFALAPPGNMQPAPALPAQADVTVAPPNTATE